MLEGFERLNISLKGIIYVSISDVAIGFPKKSVEALGNPEFVNVLINPQTKEFAVQAVTDKHDTGTFTFFHPQKSGLVFARWLNHRLIHSLATLGSLQLEQGKRYHIPGTYYPEENAIIFHLQEAEIKKEK